MNANTEIGRNARIDIMSLETIYVDDYIFELNKNNPSVEKVMGDRRYNIAHNLLTEIDYFVEGTSLGNGFGLDCLKGILCRSARNRMWQPSIVDIAQLCSPLPKTIIDTRIPGYVKDIAYSTRAGYVEPGSLISGDKSYLLAFPTLELIKHFAKRGDL